MRTFVEVVDMASDSMESVVWRPGCSANRVRGAFPYTLPYCERFPMEFRFWGISSVKPRGDRGLGILFCGRPSRRGSFQ